MSLSECFSKSSAVRLFFVLVLTLLVSGFDAGNAFGDSATEADCQALSDAADELSAIANDKKKECEDLAAANDAKIAELKEAIAGLREKLERMKVRERELKDNGLTEEYTEQLARGTAIINQISTMLEEITALTREVTDCVSEEADMHSEAADAYTAATDCYRSL